jgi:hypothetical protein
LSTQVQRELDIEDEEFIQPQELIEYFNSGVRIVESEIVKLGLRDKYLQSESTISLVQAQQDYDLPADIIENKVRKIVYRDGSIIYTLKPLKGESAYEAEDVLNQYPGSDYYRYMLYKDPSTKTQKLRLVPKAGKALANGLRVIYFRDLNRYLSDGTNCDMPDICYEYLLSYVRLRCYMKETHVNTASEKQIHDSMLALMRETLQGQVADPDMDLIDQDLSHYEDQS